MKTRLKSTAAFCLLVAFLTGCYSYTRPSYIIVLESVQAKERYGEQKIDRHRYGQSFEDGMLKILFEISPNLSSLSFSLINKSDHTLKIKFDKAAFVDINGARHRVYNSRLMWREVETDPAGTRALKPKQTIDLWFYPSDYKYGLRDLGIIVGKTIQVFLLLQIDDVANEYIFTFKVKKIYVPRLRI